MSFTSGRPALRLAVAAKAVSFFGDQVATIALMLRLQSSGAGAGAVAALLMADLVPIALLAGPAGRLADRYGSRGVLVTSGVLQAAVCSGLVFASGTGLTLLLVGVLGIGQAVNGATWSAVVPSLVPPEQVGRALGLSQAANTVGLIAAPAVSGLLTGWAGARPPLAIDAATFVAVATAGVLLPDRRTTAAAGRAVGGWRLVARHPVLRPAVLGLGLLVLVASMVNVVDVFLVRDTLHASAAWYGFAGAAYCVGMFAGSLLGGRVPGAGGSVRAFLGGAVLVGAGLAAMGLAPSVAVLAAISVGTGLANGVFSVSASALILGRAEPDERGRVGAVVGGVASAAQLIAYAAGGALATVLSPRAVFVLGGVLAVVAAGALARPLVRAVARPSALPLPHPVLAP